VPVAALLRLGKYLLKQRLGPEGVVETHRAKLVDGPAPAAGEQPLYAIKLLRADRVRGDIYQAAATRFLAAGRRLLEVERPGVARVLDVGEDAMGAYVVSEFVVGVDLRGLLEAARAGSPSHQATLDPAMAIVLGSKLVRVLVAAHAAPKHLCHLGLCPGNVIVTLQGDVVVLDFGLFASIRGMVSHGMEKWSFVAPELLGEEMEGGGLSGGAAADLFALGGLLFYLLSGRPPIVARSLAEISERIWEPLPELPGVSAQLNAAISALTTFDPQERRRAAAPVLEWLSGVGESPQEKPSPTVEAVPAPSEPVPAEPLAQPRVQAPVETPDNATAPSDTTPVVVRHRAHPPARTLDRTPKRQSRWRLALGSGLVLLVIATAMIAIRSAQRHAKEGVTIAQRRSGEAPNIGGVAAKPLRQRPPEAYLPAVPMLLPGPGKAKLPDASPPARTTEDDPIPVFPAGRFVDEEAGIPRLTPVANHLVVDTQPHGAQVWVEGEWKGQTPLDILVGQGNKQLVLVAAGYYMFRESFNAAAGAILRRALVPAMGPVQGDAFLNVVCRTSGRFPIFIDGVETGLLCPASRVPVPAGKHDVGVYIPKEHRLVAVEITVQPGIKPVEVHLAR
jgi:hypothetical protein